MGTCGWWFSVSAFVGKTMQQTWLLIFVAVSRNCHIIHKANGHWMRHRKLRPDGGSDQTERYIIQRNFISHEHLWGRERYGGDHVGAVDVTIYRRIRWSCCRTFDRSSGMSRRIPQTQNPVTDAMVEPMRWVELVVCVCVCVCVWCVLCRCLCTRSTEATSGSIPSKSQQLRETSSQIGKKRKRRCWNSRNQETLCRKIEGSWSTIFPWTCGRQLQEGYRDTCVWCKVSLGGNWCGRTRYFGERITEKEGHQRLPPNRTPQCVPKDPNCEVCKGKMSTRPRCKTTSKKRIDGIAQSTKCGDLITAARKILKKEAWVEMCTQKCSNRARWVRELYARPSDEGHGNIRNNVLFAYLFCRMKGLKRYARTIQKSLCKRVKIPKKKHDTSALRFSETNGVA